MKKDKPIVLPIVLFMLLVSPAIIYNITAIDVQLRYVAGCILNGLGVYILYIIQKRLKSLRLHENFVRSHNIPINLRHLEIMKQVNKSLYLELIDYCSHYPTRENVLSWLRDKNYNITMKKTSFQNYWESSVQDTSSLDTYSVAKGSSYNAVLELTLSELLNAIAYSNDLSTIGLPVVEPSFTFSAS